MGSPNVAFFQVLLFAYNLVHGFKRLCLPRNTAYATRDTIRRDFLSYGQAHPAGNRNLLLLPHDYHCRARFEAALKKVERLRVL